jgi:hypothetical protein
VRKERMILLGCRMTECLDDVVVVVVLQTGSLDHCLVVAGSAVVELVAVAVALDVGETVGVVAAVGVFGSWILGCLLRGCFLFGEGDVVVVVEEVEEAVVLKVLVGILRGWRCLSLRGVMAGKVLRLCCGWWVWIEVLGPAVEAGKPEDEVGFGNYQHYHLQRRSVHPSLFEFSLEEVEVVVIGY